MSNSLSAFNPEYWSKEMQIIFHRENVAIALANVEQRSLLKDGDTLNKPYRSHMQVQDYVKGTDIVAKDVDANNEQLDINTTKVIAFYIDDIDRLQNKWDVASKHAQDSQRLLNNVLDQAILAEYSNAASSIDDGDIGGTSGNAIVESTSNIHNIFAAMGRKLDGLDIPQLKRFAVIGPRDLEILRLYIAGKDTTMADVVGNNGKIGERFGFELYFTANVPFSASWTPADNPTSGSDTVSIAGVTFAFEAAPSAANDVDVGGDTEGSIDNLTAAINDAGTVGTTYIQLSDADRWKLVRAGVVSSDTASVLSIVGYGDLVVAASESSDPWSVQKSHLLAGLKGASDLVVQKSPNVEFRIAEKRLGRYVYPWMLFGKKTFLDMKDALVTVTLDASSWL